jgi:NADH-quinone oxidoreductase subunit J
MVLFIFVIMMLNMGSRAIDQETRYLSPGIWTGPAILAAILLVELILVLLSGEKHVMGGDAVSPQKVSLALFDVYFLGVELASMILLSALVGAYHLGKRDLPEESKEGNF